MKSPVAQSAVRSCRQRQLVRQPLRTEQLLPPHSQRPHGTQEEKTWSPCPKDTGVTSQSSETTRLSRPLGTALLGPHQSPTSANAPSLLLQPLLSQKQVVCWAICPCCWVTASPVQSLPDFQNFFGFPQPSVSLLAPRIHRLRLQACFKQAGERENTKQ